MAATKKKQQTKKPDTIDLLGIKGPAPFVKRVQSLAAKRKGKKPTRVDVIRAGLASGLSEETVLEKCQAVWPKTRMKNLRWQAKHATDEVKALK